MNPGELTLLLDRLLAASDEHEWVEFKHNVDEPHAIGEYLSALANAAALDGEAFGYLVWGIENGSRRVVGTTFKPTSAKTSGQLLALWLHQYLRPKLDFRFDGCTYRGLPVVLLSVPAATSQPVSFHEVEYIRIDSAKVKLSSHPDKEARLWARLNQRSDWSAELVAAACLAELDPAALAEGRQRYAEKYAHLAPEVAGWDDATFISKLKLSRGGQITRAALLLFGRDEAAQYLPLPPQLSWLLKDAEGTALDYQHFGLPLLRVPDALLARVRNLTVRYLRPGTLFPTEVPQYDTWVIREALHNAIAHQDYGLSARVNVVELPEQLVFSNTGRFLPGTVQSLLATDRSPEQYRNPCLAQAMVALKMIDTIGSGIRRMYIEQRKRFFPLPDYLIDDEHQRVEVRLTGRILDERYTQVLMQQAELTLMDVFLLDKVQKRQAITNDEAKALRTRKLIEGRQPNLHVSARVADALGEQAQYLLDRGFEKDFYLMWVLKRLRMGDCKRSDLERLLLSKLPDVLSAQQKRNKVKNLLAEMSRKALITADGKRGQGAVWRLLPAGLDRLVAEARA
ncbi:MAG: putative DNA binding domain-containing protein [Ideonella sp.]|nr:putative DNA binding domain-containing protein [Ideonella sp.]